MMKGLSELEIKQVSGGFFFAPFLQGTIIGLGSYIVNKAAHQELMSYEGAAAGAAGGGIIGNIVRRPGFFAINSAGQAIAQEHQ